MDKKKMLSMLIALTLVAVIGVGATLAYFTDSEEKKNVITMGHVDIDLDEPNFDKEDGTPDDTIENIVPGQDITKDPTITVKKGSADAYIRASVEVTISNANDLSEEVKEARIQEIQAALNIQDGWTSGEDGYYYYNAIVKAEESIVLFDTVKIPSSWGNEMADVTFEIIVKAEAIQSDNFEPAKDAAGNIIGWVDDEGQPITAETYDKAVAVDADEDNAE